MGMKFNYSGYVGSVEYDVRDKLFHGRVQGVSDVISYEGATVDDLEEDFMDAVDSYLIGLDKLKPKSKIEARTYPLEEAMKYLRMRRNLRRLYHKLAPKARSQFSQNC